MMENHYGRRQREEFLNMYVGVGDVWTKIFEGNRKFYSAVYFDLLTGLWVRGKSMKGEALHYIRAIKSSSSISKCLDFAIRAGFIVEENDPDDKRAKLVDLTPEMKIKIDTFFDEIIDKNLISLEKIKNME